MREIPLTQGKVAVVDDSDYEVLNQYKWHASRNKDNYYAVRKSLLSDIRGRQKTIKMHREIMGASPAEVIDHKDHNTLNNCRSNLRICTQEQNNQNKISKNMINGKYKGVQPSCWGGFTARIRSKGKDIYIGLFKSREEAALAYNAVAVEIFGEFASLNTI